MKRFLLVYGSQTGQSQVISEQIAEKATSKGFKVDVNCLDQSGAKFHLEQEPVVVIVCSSTGDGDPPDNAAKFWRKLKKRTLPEDHLAKCHYTVLGLGDSNYSNFCNMGKLLDERMSALGATRFYEAGFADDAVGLEAVVEPWIDGLWSALSSLFDQETNEEQSTKANARMFPDVILAGKQMRSYTSKDSILSSPDELRMKGISSPIPNKQIDYGPGPDSLLVPNLLAHERKRSGSLPVAIDVQTKSELTRTYTVGAKPGEEIKKTKDLESLPPISSKLSLTASPKFGRSRSPSTSPNQDKNKFNLTEDVNVNSPKSSPSHQLFSPTNSNSPQPSPPMSPRPHRSVRCSSPVLSSHKVRSLSKKASADALKPADRPMFYSPQLVRSKMLDSSPTHRHSSTNLKNFSPNTNNQDPPTKASTLWTGYSQGSLKPLEGRESSYDALECQENRKKILTSAADIVNGVVIQRHQRLPKIKGSNFSSPALNRPLQQHNQGEGLTLPSTKEEAEESCTSVLSLQQSNSGLELKDLSLPSFQPPYLNVDVKKPIQKRSPYPVASVPYTTASQLYTAHLVSAKKITADDAAKCTLQLSFRVESESEGKEFSYEPGDAFGFVCPNDSKEVDYLLERLGLMAITDYEIDLQILSETRKKNPVIPKHIPATCTVRHFFTHCAAIRSIPKKAFLFMLSQYTDNEKEKRRLEELCSKQGASEYTHLFIEYHFDLLDVLNAFPSCTPPLPRLIEFLPRLQPRYYSVACSPTASQSHFDIVFNVEEISKREWMDQSRYGVCSGWLSRLGQQIVSTTSESSVDPPRHQEQVTIFTRLINPFHLPSDPSIPIIMVGPGTGVAPFIGFLQHRRSLNVKKDLLGPSWLFYGCRHPLKDYLFKKELAAYVADGTLTHLLVAFSRYEDVQGHRHYVQDNIRAKGKLLSTAIMESNAVVYVCGDAHNMSKDVKEAFIDILSDYFQDKASPVATAQEMLATMQEDRRYILDIWT